MKIEQPIQWKHCNTIDKTLKNLLSGQEMHAALLHPSNDQDGLVWEEFEFIGDRVLGLVVATLLNKIPHKTLGELANHYNSLVRSEYLVNAAYSMGLDVALSRINKNKAFMLSKRVLADSVEVLLGFIYLKIGLDLCFEIISFYWDKGIKDTYICLDAKTALQEWLQKRSMPLPVYKRDTTTDTVHSGNAEADKYTTTIAVRLEVVNFGHTLGVGPTRKEAEQTAAQDMLDKLQG